MPSAVNVGYCDTCGKTVPVGHRVLNESVYLAKQCPTCGQDEILASMDADTYFRKRSLDLQDHRRDCSLRCNICQHPFPFRNVQIEITNSCNMSCPICFTKEQRAALRFEPPVEYFEKMFQYFSDQEPRPNIGFFGGEPTVREDLFELIELAANYGLQVGIITNGLRLADEVYCRDLIATGANIGFQFDGTGEKAYRLLRGDSAVLEKKLKALENIEKHARDKISIFCTVARGINDGDIAGLFRFCHERQDFIHSVYLLPLVKTWEDENARFEWKDRDRLLCEDIEKLVALSLKEPVEFLPAGSVGVLEPLRWLRKEPFEFEGVHPNCESITYLIARNGSFIPISRLLKTSLFQMAADFMKVRNGASRTAPLESTGESAKGAVRSRIGERLGRVALNMRCAALLLKHIDRKHLGGSRGIIERFADAGRILLHTEQNGKLSKTIRAVTGLGPSLRLIVLPYQDGSRIESHRLQRCQTGMGFLDPDTDSVKTVPLCAWDNYRTDTLRKIAAAYPAER